MTPDRWRPEEDECRHGYTTEQGCPWCEKDGSGVVEVDGFEYEHNQQMEEGDTVSLSARDLSMIAQGWDAAVAAMRYEDGTPVQVVSMVNPYRPVRSGEQAE